MKQQNAGSAQDCIADLTALGGMRVWSILITIFGDAVAPRGGVVPAVVLQAILEPLGIKPEAMRVALHRLVKDGWIARQKSGRQSFYALTAQGRREFLSASKRIYATGPAMQGPWHLAILPPKPDPQRAALENDLVADGYIQITATTFMGHAQTNCPSQDVLIAQSQITQFPDWARTALAPPLLAQDYENLETALKVPQRIVVSDPHEATALRILMIHQWRRILLRHPDLPASFLPKGWRGEAVRQIVLAQHKRLSQRADPWLDAQIAPRQSD